MSPGVSLQTFSLFLQLSLFDRWQSTALGALSFLPCAVRLQLPLNAISTEHLINMNELKMRERVFKRNVRARELES